MKLKLKTPESLIVFGVLTLILFPIRMLFVTYVSTNNYGSFGVASAIAILMVFLVKKKKLGSFGRMFEHQMQLLNNSKRKYMVYGSICFNLFLTIVFLSAISLAETTYHDQKVAVEKQLLANNNGKQVTVKDSVDILKKSTPQEIIYGLLYSAFIVLFNFPLFSSIVSSMNDASGGYFGHMAIVVMVEMIETLGILLAYKYIFPQKKTLNNKLCPACKTPLTNYRMEDNGIGMIGLTADCEICKMYIRVQDYFPELDTTIKEKMIKDQ